MDEGAAAALRALCDAVIAYDRAIFACANDPARMASFCTAEGTDLDDLYDRMVTFARAGASPKEGSDG